MMQKTDSSAIIFTRRSECFFLILLWLSFQGSFSIATKREEKWKEIRIMHWVLALVVLVQAASSLPITNLPGVSWTIPFAQYSGYITVDKYANRNLFYWFVESQQNPAKDPVVVWLQGGPGCSSLIGLFTEHGPFVPNLAGGLDQFSLSWNKIANVLYIEAPVGVGFSYSDNASDYYTDDEKTAVDNLAFLETWFASEFPQYRSNDLWITGESYAGMYVPELVQKILSQSPTLSARLKGFMVGNPCMNCPDSMAQAYTLQVQLFYWHGLVPFSLYQKWMTSSCALPNANPSRACLDLFDSINNIIGNYDPDNLYTDFCYGNATLEGTVLQNPNCVTVDDKLDEYLNSADVQRAIHARIGTTWSDCTDGPLNYTTLWQDMTPYYKYIFSKSPSIRVLIYSGDVDIATVPHAVTQMCVANLGGALVQPWRPWIVNGAIAGYVEVYDRYTYATVKGAGHEVPTYQPWSAYHLFQNFLTGQPL